MNIQEEEERDFYHPSIQECLEFEVRSMAHPDPELCCCRGRGWVGTNYDTWIECPCHRGREHPEMCDE